MRTRAVATMMCEPIVNHLKPWIRTRSTVFVLGIFSIVACGPTWADDPAADKPSDPPAARKGGPRAEPTEARLSAALRPAAISELLERDPMAVIRAGREFYETQVRDYTCTFVKQERLKGRLGKVERIEVRFRKKPFSVFFVWKENANKVRRALYIDRPDYVDKKGRKLARVEPNGAIARLFVRDIKLPLHSKRSREVSRRSLDDFGFGALFRMLEEYNTAAAEKGVLRFRFVGTGQIDGRPTYVFERYLPYQGEDGPWPDAKMVLHLDQQWLLPVAVYSYADAKGTKLLGSYVFEDVKLNVGLTDRDFEF